MADGIRSHAGEILPQISPHFGTGKSVFRLGVTSLPVPGEAYPT